MRAALIYPIPLLITFVLLLFPHDIVAQDHPVPIYDELYNKLEYPKADTNIRSLLEHGVNRYKQAPDSALPVFMKVLQQATVRQQQHEISEAFSYIVTIYNNRGAYDRAYQITRVMHQQATEKKWTEVLPAVYNSFANRHQRMGAYDSAMYYYYQAIHTIEANPQYANPSALPTLYTNLSGILEVLGKFERGLFYLNKAEAEARLLDHRHLLTLILINKGNAFNNLKQYDSSFNCLKEALQIAEDNKYLQWQHLALCNLGSTLYEQGRASAALPYLLQALNLKGDIDPRYRSTNIASLGKVYLALKNYAMAEHYLSLSIEKATLLSISRDLVDGYHARAGLYFETGQYKKAYEDLFTYLGLKDSVESKETIHHISQLEVKYQTTLKDKEITEKQLQISQQQAQIKQKNLWITGISFGALLLAAISGLLYSLYKTNWHQKRLQDEKVKSLEQIQEIALLRAMMKGEEKERTRIAQDLHDGIGGMLAAIKMNVHSLKDETPELQQRPGYNKISDMLTDAATEVRKTAHNLMPDALARQGLRDALLHYCEQNSNKQLHIDMQFESGAIDNKTAELFIYRLIQELIQNIVKHADASRAVVQFMRIHDTYSITVEDNGKGFNQQADTTGSGLKNIHGRVHTLNGFIDISSGHGKGTIVHIEFDYLRLKNL